MTDTNAIGIPQKLPNCRLLSDGMRFGQDFSKLKRMRKINRERGAKVTKKWRGRPRREGTYIRNGRGRNQSDTNVKNMMRPLVAGAKPTLREELQSEFRSCNRY
ncbi:Uncharacterized protein APZ42_029484 [Daphnia magna]|uniref:Uncharacterized protein n=1 Tax=Daphnia magna TaxID=35525 RepID=A0A164PLW6_9CRUS|nr:Uncharacterized protein APZ42_029484 [Daphnia magna]